MDPTDSGVESVGHFIVLPYDTAEVGLYEEKVCTDDGRVLLARLVMQFDRIVSAALFSKIRTECKRQSFVLKPINRTVCKNGPRS